MNSADHKFRVYPAQYFSITLTREELGLSREEFEEFDFELDKVFRKGYRINRLAEDAYPDYSDLYGTLVSKHENIYDEWIEYELVVVTDNLLQESAQLEYALKREMLSLVPKFKYDSLLEVADEEFFEEVDSVVVDWAYSILGEDSFDPCEDHGCHYDEEFGRTCAVYFTNITNKQALTLLQEAQKGGAVNCVHEEERGLQTRRGMSETRMDFSVENARKVFGPFIEKRKNGQ